LREIVVYLVREGARGEGARREGRSEKGERDQPET